MLPLVTITFSRIKSNLKKIPEPFPNVKNSSTYSQPVDTVKTHVLPKNFFHIKIGKYLPHIQFQDCLIIVLCHFNLRCTFRGFCELRTTVPLPPPTKKNHLWPPWQCYLALDNNHLRSLLLLQSIFSLEGI